MLQGKTEPSGRGPSQEEDALAAEEVHSLRMGEEPSRVVAQTQGPVRAGTEEVIAIFIQELPILDPDNRFDLLCE